MTARQPPLLDMTPQGEFRTPAFKLSVPMRVGLAALAVSFVAGAVATFALLLSLVLFVVPVALAAAAVAYVAMRLNASRGQSRVVVRKV